MKNIVLKTTACLALFALTTSVNAQEAKGGKLLEKFTKLDTNSDGFLDKEEAAKFNDGKMTRNFDRMDTNKDAKISLEELKAYRAKRKQAKKEAAAK